MTNRFKITELAREDQGPIGQTQHPYLFTSSQSQANQARTGRLRLSSFSQYQSESCDPQFPLLLFREEKQTCSAASDGWEDYAKGQDVSEFKINQILISVYHRWSHIYTHHLFKHSHNCLPIWCFICPHMSTMHMCLLHVHCTCTHAYANVWELAHIRTCVHMLI